MKLTIEKGSENYTCTIVEIKQLFPIEGADRILRTVIFGNDVIVGKDTKIGDKRLYFCSGTRVNELYCTYNDLLTDETKNRNPVKGYISHKQFRVKAIKLKGVISNGMLLPIDSLEFVIKLITTKEIKELKVGDEFTTINNLKICQKYVMPTKAQELRNQQKPVKVSRLVDKQFYLHNDTSNLRKNIHLIQPSDFISLHYKKHGTSFVVGNILTNKKLSRWEKVAKFFGAKILSTEYDIIYSSRKVIKNGFHNANPSHFYKEDIWKIAADEIKEFIPKNWTLYGEIVGYTPGGATIQKGYDYGCNPGEHKTFIYRITVVNEDGYRIELSDSQIKEFCDKNGLNYSETFIWSGEARDYFDTMGISNDEEWREHFIQTLEEEHNEKDCYMCVNKVPEEGIVLRVDKMFSYDAYKLKSKKFILRESNEQELEVTNIEDEQTEES